MTNLNKEFSNGKYFIVLTLILTLYYVEYKYTLSNNINQFFRRNIFLFR